jgi:hypothetical protein
MPLKVRVDPEEKVLYLDGSGVVTDDDLLLYVEEYLSKEEYSSFDEFLDLSASDLFDLTYAGLSRLAEAAAATDPDATRTKIAILVSETLGKGLSRMYQSLREGKGGRRETRIFMDESECREWLGLLP